MDSKEFYRKNNQWAKDNADKILLLLPKGKKSEIQEYAKFKNKSVNAVLNELIEKGIKRDLDYRFKSQCDEEEEKIKMPWDED